MAAPSTGHPVTITVGAIWRFRVEPQPPRPLRISAAATVVHVFLILTRVIFGVVYFKECPQQPNIPNYLLGLALASLMMIPFVTLPFESNAAQPQENPTGLKVCLMCLLGVFTHIWILAGDVWVFSIYQPNYDTAAPDGLYCNRTLYTFALWNAVWETFVVWVLLAKFCKGLMCCVMMSPVPTDTQFYRNV